MYSIKTLVSTPILKENRKILPKIGLLIILFLSACSPAVATGGAVPVQDTSTAVRDTPTGAVPTPTLEPTLVPTYTPEGPIYPFYLPLAKKPDIQPQTIGAVSVTIEWAYVDEGRVAIQYTISGLDWPDGSNLDAMQQVSISIPALSSFKFGGFSGGSSGNLSSVQGGVVTGSSDQALFDGALDADKYPTIDVKVDIPVEGPTKIGTFHFTFTAPVANGSKLENLNQTVVANNVSMTLKSMILNPSYVQALICFQMPSAVDWGLTTSKITISGREYPVSGVGIASPKDDPVSAVTSPERCNDVGFDVAYDKNSVTSVTLTVPRLQASVNEVVTQEVVDRANQRLADQGIEFNYVNVDHGGNIVVLKRPDGATDPEIYPLIWDAMAEQYEGPWVFTVEIPK